MQGEAHRWRQVADVGAAGLLVLILGSTLVIAKGALQHSGPLTLAALRYCLAALVLLPPAVRHERRIGSWPKQVWLRLAAIGLSFYALGNGALFLALRYVPAATAGLVLGLVPLVTLLAGAVWLGEGATRGQLVGLLLALLGIAVFFAPGLAPGEPVGLVLLAVGLLGSASLGILGRPLALSGQGHTLMLTAAPLTIGGLVLLPVALLAEGPPQYSLVDWATVIWLALVNTALAYLLYNRILRSQAAFAVSALTSLSPCILLLDVVRCA